MISITRQKFLAALVSSLAVVCAGASAQQYPVKPVRIVVPTVPGGGTDYTARFIAQRLGPALGGSVVIDNKPGASGHIGLDLVAKSPPDGYTLVMPITSFATDPSLYDKLPFDTVKDFAPIVMVSRAPLLLVVHPTVPAQTPSELIAYAKANPGKLNYGNAGSGTMSNFAAELFKKTAGVDMAAIRYKGAGQIMTDLVSGRIQVYFSTIPAALQLSQAGRLRVLAVTSPTRVAELPNVPTLAEGALPGFDVVSWFGLFAPAGTPAPVIERINKEVLTILALPETRQAFAREGLIEGSGSPEWLQQFLLTDIAKWKKVAADAGIKRD